METTEQKPLTKHLKAAVNQLEKQRAKHHKRMTDLINKRGQIQMEIDDIDAASKALSEQISKLKGQ